MKSKSTQDIFRKVDKTSEELPELIEQFLAVSKSRPGRKPRYSTAMVQLHARIPPETKAAMVAEFGGVQAAVDKLVIEALSPCSDCGARWHDSGCDSCRSEERRCKTRSKPS